MIRSRLASASVVIGLLISANSIASANETTSSTVTRVRALLARSALAWNRGDLDSFMTSYEDSPTTEYVNMKTVIRGYAAIRAHYAEHYGTVGAPKLSLSDTDVRPLGGDYAVVIAHWHLAMANGSHPTGIFSLVLHRSADGWRIIVDHSP